MAGRRIVLAGDPVPDEDWEEWNPETTSFMVHAVAGSAAGVAEHTAMFPVDTYKTHCQVSRGTPLPFLKLMEKRGFFGMWRGARAMFVACIPSHAMYFTVYEAAKATFGANEQGHTPLAAGASGALATVLHDGVLTPMDVVKQRLQLGYYSGVSDCVRTMLRQEGLGAFFRSYPTTVIMNIPYAATVVATNESLKEVLNPDRQHDMTAYLMSGAGAGGLAASVTTPLDNIKTRLQTQRLRVMAPSENRYEARVRSLNPTPSSSAPGGLRIQPVASFYTSSTPAYTGIRDAASKIYAEAGFLGFFRGIRARVLAHTPSMAISWSTYEMVKHLLNPMET